MRTLKEFKDQLRADAERTDRAWNEQNYEGESNNIFTEVTVSDAEFVSLVVDAFLGENYYIVDPLSSEQVNTILLANILHWKENLKRKFWTACCASAAAGFILAMILNFLH